MKRSKNTSVCIKLSIGDKVQEIEGKQRIGIIKDIVIVPNGVHSIELVALLFVELENGNNLSATSNHFKPLENELYSEFFPSVHGIHLDDRK